MELLPPTAPSNASGLHADARSPLAIAPDPSSGRLYTYWSLPSPRRFSPFPGLGSRFECCPCVHQNHHSHSQIRIALLQRVHILPIQILHLQLGFLQIGILPLQKELFVMKTSMSILPNPRPRFEESIPATREKPHSRNQNPLPVLTAGRRGCLSHYRHDPTQNPRASRLHRNKP